MNYLLDCQPYLKENNLNGWMLKFQDTEPPVQEPKQKKRRMSPNVVFLERLPRCSECNSNHVIDDVETGSVVCTACGIVQATPSLTTGPANMSADRMMNGTRIAIHRYSRVIYFRSFMLSIQGVTSPEISKQNEKALRLMLAGKSSIKPTNVRECLKKMGLSGRYRRHIESLTETLSDGKYKPLKIPHDTLIRLLTLFRKVECAWDHGVKQDNTTRKVFLSYPYVYYQLCFHLDVMHLTDASYLLKSPKLLFKLHTIYGKIATQVGLEYDTVSTRDPIPKKKKFK
jgi:hypothetical protein